MGLLLHKLRTFIRTNFAPIPVYVAEKWHRRLKIVYLICAWNLFGYAVYKIFSNKDKNKDIPMSLYIAKNLQLGNTKLIKMNNLNVEVFDLTEEEINKQYELYENKENQT